MRVGWWLPIGVALTALAVPADAAELKLEFRAGRVTLTARDVSVRQILTEWAKVGKTHIVNGDRVSGNLVTLQLDELPERQALDVVLRSAAGYLAAPRQPGNPGPSVYDRILVLAVSNPPAVPNRPGGSPTNPAASQFPGPAPAPLPPPPAPLVAPVIDDSADDDDAIPPPRGGTMAPGMPTTPATPAPAGNTQPFSRPPYVPPTTAAPGGTSVPGMVTPPPPQQPNQPAGRPNPNK